jgi:hypothetical protein
MLLMFLVKAAERKRPVCCVSGGALATSAAVLGGRDVQYPGKALGVIASRYGTVIREPIVRSTSLPVEKPLPAAMRCEGGGVTAFRGTDRVSIGPVGPSSCSSSLFTTSGECRAGTRLLGFAHSRREAHVS